MFQECAVAQNELLKEFLERIQSRKQEVCVVALFAVSCRHLLK